MSAPHFGMVGVIFPEGAPPADLERRLSGSFEPTPHTQLTTWRAPGVFAVTAQHAYETDGNAGRSERAMPQSGGILGLVCADISARSTLDVEAASRCVTAVTDDDHSALKALDGSWVGFAWDPERRVARFFRDGAGLRLLFVARLPDRIVFATDTRLMVAAGVPRQFDGQAAAEYLHFFYAAGPRSLLRDASAVLPAHFMTLDAAGARQKRWSPSRWVPGESLGDPAAIERAVERELPKFEELLITAVTACLPPRGRVALSLSGGKDSSVLAYVLSRICPERVLAFTVGMPDKRNDEGEDAALVCKALGLQHFVHVATDAEIADGVRSLSRVLDQPVGDIAALPYYLAMRKLPEDCQVILDGSGNDFYFGFHYGWKLKRLEQRLDLRKKVPGPLWKPLLWAMSHSTERMRRLATFWRKPVEENFAAWEGWTREELADLLNRDVSFEDSYWWRTERKLDLARHLEYQSELVGHVWEPNASFRKAGHFAQATGRIVRFPFTDQRLVAWMNAQPLEFKHNGASNKHLLRAYMQRTLPREIVEKPKKGFIFDLNRVLMNPLYPWAEEMRRAGRLRYSPDWSQSQIDKLLDKYRRDPADQRWQQRVYSLCMLNSSFTSPNSQDSGGA
jgi:asparagine synthase (glutamine-hydrolysing)